MSENLAATSPEYLRIAASDPLGLDDALRELPARNEAGDVVWLADATSLAVERAGALDTPDSAAAAASLRDLDFLASSLLRHGSDPITDIVGLEHTMISMGNIAGTVPRSTVTTYAAGNPIGDRQRSFTGSPEEDLFIAGLRESYFRLEGATENLAQVELRNPDHSEALKAALRSASSGMDAMIESVVDVYRGISPEYFTHVMRPYFEPLTIGGEHCSAANGGQLQLVALEAMLWGFTTDDPEWHGFYEENLPYLSPTQRDALSTFHGRNGGQTVLAQVTSEAEAGNADPETLDALTDLFRKIRKFRYPHYKVAEDSFNLRPEGAVGSGSYTLEILASLITRTESNMDALRESE